MDPLVHPNSDDLESSDYDSMTESRTNDYNNDTDPARYYDCIRYLTLDARRGYLSESDRCSQGCSSELCLIEGGGSYRAHHIRGQAIYIGSIFY